NGAIKLVRRHGRHRPDQVVTMHRTAWSPSPECARAGMPRYSSYAYAQAMAGDIERERVVIEAPTTCACCGGSRLAKIGEDVTKTLEEIPRRFKVVETVREKFTCRDCEKISQPPAPFHATPRGFIGPQLLATIL